MRSLGLVLWIFLSLIFVASPAAADPCGVAIAVGQRVVVVDGKSLVRKDGKVDVAALDAELARRHAALRGACATQAHLSADEKVAYADVVTVMDSARKAGFTELAFGDETSSPPAAATGDVADAIVVAISTNEILVGGKVITTVSAAAAGSGPIPELAAVMTGPAERSIVIQADSSTSQAVLDRVVKTAASTGHVNVMFAVQRARN